MGRWHNCPSLAVFWCNGIFLVFYFYSIYAASNRYSQFKINAGNPKFGFNWKENYILFYLISILIACLLWLLFLYSSIFQTGNLANDYVELGKISSVTEDNITSSRCAAVCGRILRRFRYHFIPFNAVIHLLGAFFLLVPIPLLIEEERQHGISSTGLGQSKSFICTYIPEITNFLLAAFCLTVRLPTVFSSASRSFGIIFSVFVFIATFNIFLHCVSNEFVVSLQSKYNWRIAISNIAIFLVSITNFCLIYEHGRTRFLESIVSHRLDLQDQSSTKSGVSLFSRSIAEKYWPNISAFFLWIVFIVLYVDQYSTNVIYNALYLVDICISIIHCLVWLVVWLLFTFKSDWEFSGSRTHMKVMIASRDHSFHVPQTCIKPCDTIYTCFQISDQVRSLSSQSSKTPNHDLSSGSSSSSSRVSEKASLQKHIPSISKQLDFPECNYEDLVTYKPTIRPPSKNTLKEISEENPDYQEMFQIRSEVSPTNIEFFKSPNISQRSSNVHSSDSGIGINFRDNPDYIFSNKVSDNEILKYRNFSPQGMFLSKAQEFNIDEELLDTCELTTNNMCSDV